LVSVWVPIKVIEGALTMSTGTRALCDKFNVTPLIGKVTGPDGADEKSQPVAGTAAPLPAVKGPGCLISTKLCCTDGAGAAGMPDAVAPPPPPLLHAASHNGARIPVARPKRFGIVSPYFSGSQLQHFHMRTRYRQPPVPGADHRIA
jgi:hypothetical protein